jgi:hypothetical protein
VGRDLDEQLLEQAGVRRRRLFDAVQWGHDRTQLAMPDNLVRFLVSVVIAALVCAGCVGFSFVKNAIEQARANQGSSIGQSAPSASVRR